MRCGLCKESSVYHRQIKWEIMTYWEELVQKENFLMCEETKNCISGTGTSLSIYHATLNLKLFQPFSFGIWLGCTVYGEIEDSSSGFGPIHQNSYKHCLHKFYSHSIVYCVRLLPCSLLVTHRDQYNCEQSIITEKIPSIFTSKEEGLLLLSALSAKEKVDSGCNILHWQEVGEYSVGKCCHKKKKKNPDGIQPAVRYISVKTIFTAGWIRTSNLGL